MSRNAKVMIAHSQNIGFIRGMLLKQYNILPRIVMPTQWQSNMLIVNGKQTRQKKEVSIKVASDYWDVGKDHNKADAICIGLYGCELIRLGIEP
jgi:hypothetical protein